MELSDKKKKKTEWKFGHRNQETLKKNSYPGVKLTLVEHEPGVAVLLLVNLV